MSHPLASEPVPRLLLRLAVPAIFSQIIAIAYSIVDRIWLGQLEESAPAMAAVGASLPAAIITGALVFLLGRGGAPLATIALGADNLPRAQKLLGCSLFCLIGSSILCCGIQFLGAEFIAFSFGARGDDLPLAVEYLRVCSIGYLFFMPGMGLNFYINSLGFTKAGMITSIIGCGVNIALDPLFIHTFGLGVCGAAIATVIAQFCSFLWVIYFFSMPKAQIRPQVESTKLDLQLLKQILTLGMASAFMFGSEAILLICFNA